MLTQAELKSKLDYDSETGVFRWIYAVGRRVKSRSIAGNEDIGGYILITVNYKSYLAHRLAWLYVYGVWPKDQIDHINRNKHDNRIVNLRDVTQQENNKNMKLSCRNTSGITGVVWDKDAKKWKAQLWTDKNPVYLGRFTDKFEAICCRKSAENKYGFHPNHGR